MRLQEKILDQSRMLGAGLALVGSGIAFAGLFLPWAYKCSPISPSFPECVHPGPTVVETMIPIGSNWPEGSSPIVLLPLLALAVALALLFLPARKFGDITGFGVAVAIFGMCGTLGGATLPMLGWSDNAGIWHWDWGVGLSLLGYAVLIVGALLLRRYAAYGVAARARGQDIH